MAENRHNPDEQAPIFIVTLLILGVIGLGTVGYMAIEGWSPLDSAYMVVSTLSTVGLGEVNPLSPAGKVFTGLLIIFGIGIVYYVVRIIFESTISLKLEEVLTDKKIIDQIEHLDDHFVLVGWGRVGSDTASEMKRSGVPVAVIDKDPDQVEEARDEGFLALEGDGSDEEVLKDAGLKKAKGLIVATGDDGDNILIIITAKGINPNLFIVARSNEEETAQKLIRVGANRVVVPYRIGASRMAMMAAKPQVADFIDEIVSDDEGHLQIQDIKVRADSEAAGTPLGQSLANKSSGVVVLAVHKNDGDIMVNPSPSTVVSADDRLIIMGTQDSLSQAQKKL